MFHHELDWLAALVTRLTNTHEARRAEPWSVSDAPADYIEQQLKAIVGMELEIKRLEGKWKMSQNRAPADIDGVIHGLSESSAPQDQTVASIVRERRPAKP
jgi:transcriptional regulator